MSLRSKLTPVKDFKVLLFGPFVGKYVKYGQNPPGFDFLDAMGDMTGSQVARDSLRAVGIKPEALGALVTRIYGNGRAGAREVAFLYF